MLENIFLNYFIIEKKIFESKKEALRVQTILITIMFLHNFSNIL